MTTLTIPEREQLAYITGSTNEAALLASLDDCHEALAREAVHYTNALEEIQALQCEIHLLKGIRR